ncbi:MAG: DUF2752 domain-containing protein [Anaerolineales bacterium]
MEDTLQTQFQRIWYAPAFSSLLESRTELNMIMGAGIIHFGLTFAGYKGWQCPFLAATGVPCPGCGLTRAIIQLVHGNISASLQTHAFAPIFLIAMIILLSVFLLPEKLRLHVISFVNKVETRTGLTAWVFFTLMLYWAFRLIA